MKRNRPTNLLLACATLMFSAPRLYADDSIPNWPLPKPSGRSALADLSGALPFFPVTPCRLVDTRGNGAPLTGGFLGAGASRNYHLAGAGTCGIPPAAAAISLNITVVNTAGPGFLQAYPQGGSAGGVSSINYVAGQVLANAAIVPMNLGSITVTAGVSGTDVIIDTNGYFSSTATSGAGLTLFPSTPNPGLYVFNSSMTCTTACGVLAEAASVAKNATAISAQATGAAQNNYGIFSVAFGTGGTFPPVSADYSAGVFGRASASAANVAGVLGDTYSSAANADGVLGIANDTSANGGQFYNSASGTNTNLASGGNGVSTNANINGASLSISGAKAFISPHPEDPSKEIKYISVEARTSDVYFRGTGHLVNGVARIDVPEDFRLTAREDSYMTTATSVGSHAFSLAVESEGPDGIVIRGPHEGAFHFVVYAERDVLRDHQAVQTNVDFTPAMLAKGDSTRNMPERMKALLVANGTMNADGSFNEATARRLGWALPAPPRASPAVASPTRP